jgi:hypothetical protein
MSGSQDSNLKKKHFETFFDFCDMIENNQKFITYFEHLTYEDLLKFF